jgi:hypothetical protein
VGTILERKKAGDYMANEENLKPFTSDQSREEAVKNGRKGGKASGKARREKKAFKETLELLLKMPLYDGKKQNINSIKNFANIKGKNITTQEAMLIAQVQKAMKGDNQSITFIRDTIGEKPVEMIGFQDIELVIEDEVKIE